MGKAIELLNSSEFVHRALKYGLVGNSPLTLARLRRKFIAYQEVLIAGGTAAKAQRSLDAAIARGDYDALLSCVEPVTYGLKALLDARPDLGTMWEIASDSSFAPDWNDYGAGSDANRMVIVRNPPIPELRCGCKYPEHMTEFNPSGFLNLNGFYLRVARLRSLRLFELGFIVAFNKDGFTAISIDHLGKCHCYSFALKTKPDACLRILLNPATAESAIRISQENVSPEEAFGFRRAREAFIDLLPYLGIYLERVADLLQHEH